MNNRYIWSIDGAVTGTSCPGQGRHENNGNEEVRQISKTGASPSEADTVSIFKALLPGFNYT